MPISTHSSPRTRPYDSVQYHLVFKLEKALDDKEIIIAAFRVIEGAFDNTHTSVIEETARVHKTGKLTCTTSKYH